MNVTFYQFSKRENSTKQPGGGAGYNVTLKESSSVLSPSIRLVWPGAGSPVHYNYAYIPHYARYYFVRNWTYSDRQWEADLTVDPLASWKSYIGNETKYVLRSASKFSTDVIDTMYPAKAGMLTDTISYDMGLVAGTYQTGSFILGVTTTDGSGEFGGVAYYAMAPTVAAYVIQDLYANALSLFNITPQSVEEALTQIGEIALKTILKPFEYIQSIKWMPYNFTGAPVLGFNIGYIPVNLQGRTAYRLSPVTAVYSRATTLLYDAEDPTDMLWTQLSPFRSYSVNFNPFGNFMLDAARVQAPLSSLIAKVYLDAISGMGRLHIYKGSQIVGQPDVITDTLVDATANVSTAVTIANSTSDARAIASGISNIVMGAVRAYEGDTGGVAQAFSGIGTAFDSLFALPQAFGGSSGSILGDTKLYFQKHQMTPVDEDIPERGRPLCQREKISDLSGYVLCAEGDISAPATMSELMSIKSYLEGGFYYE